jgi:cyclopropane fatty-acyl-phospholipid synthase-like methyltransferase
MGKKTMTNDAAKDALKMLAASEARDGTVVEFWNTAHETNEGYWLSGYTGPDIWHRLEVEERVVPGAVVLNIGVGVGSCTRALVERGCVVHALDISSIALQRVEAVAIPWLASEIIRLPQNTFDLALSHLVAQHMPDDDLHAQLYAVVRALRDKGVFAMQFLKPIDKRQEAIVTIDQPRSSQKGGSIFRTPEKVEQMVKAAGGTVLRSVAKESSIEQQWAWHVMHVGRASSANTGL